MIVSKLFCILLGLEIFALTYYLSVIRIGYRNVQSLTDYISVLIAAAFGALTYYLVDRVIERKQANKEKIAKEALLPLLPAGETLLAYTRGWAYDDRPWRLIVRTIRDVIFGNPRRIYYYVGVSDQSLIIIWSDGNIPTVTEHVLLRSQVKQLKFESILISGHRLFIQFAAKPIILWIDRDYMMTRRAKELAKVWNGENQ